MKFCNKKVIMTFALGFVLSTGIITNTSQSAYAAHPVEISAPVTSTLSNQEPIVTNTKEVNHEEAAAQANHQSSSHAGKSQVVALLLCLFLGNLGVHRFYLGYTTIGVIQLLTLGGLGIWSLIDLIRIIIGDLEPKNGSYEKTF